MLYDKFSMSELYRLSQPEVNARFESIVAGLYAVSLKYPDESITGFTNQCVAYDVLASRAKNLISYEAMESVRNRMDFIVKFVFNRFGNLRNGPENLVQGAEGEIRRLAKLNKIEFHAIVKAVGLLKIVNRDDRSSRDLSVSENGAFGRIEGVKIYCDIDGIYRAGFAIENAVVDDDKDITEFPSKGEVIVVPVEPNSGAMMYKVVGPEDDPLR